MKSRESLSLAQTFIFLLLLLIMIKWLFFNLPQFFVRSYPLVNDRVREALGDTFYEEFMVRIQIDLSNVMKDFNSDTLKGRVYVMMRAMETIMHHMMS